MKRLEKKKKQAKPKVESVCLNCGKNEAHFVPPSFGEEGFFICEKPKKEKE